MSIPPDRLLSVDEAVALILDRARPLNAVLRSPMTGGGKHGTILAEPIDADLDSPPFDKATMDGYAVRSADLTHPGERRLKLVATIHAGQVGDRPIEPGEAAAIMTGAPLPAGADAVVNIERTRIEPGQPDRVVLNLPAAVPPGQFVMPRGREMRRGDRLLEAGTRLTPAVIGLIAAAGRAAVMMIPRPKVAVVATGDELVHPHEVPGPGQIRNSNGAMLTALVNEWSGGPRPITPYPVILRDQLDDLIGSLRRTGLRWYDVLILSGGVSMGEKDLVPAALRELGVESVFHKVAVKPGKPIWFGVGPARQGVSPGTLVFGLPGNPASCVVGFLLFVRPALDALAGRGKRPTPIEAARLGADFRHKGDRPTYHPARIVDGIVTPLPWAGSADLRAVALADGFAAFPSGDREHKQGDPIGFLRL